MKEKAIARFKEVFNREASIVVKSPGRINLIGEHTDYNEGYVLPAAIDKYAYVAVASRNDMEIHLYADDLGENLTVLMEEVKPSEVGWANYILGVVNQLLERGLSFSGFDLLVKGDIPLGAGLSSSAALESAVGFALNDLFQLNLPKTEI